MTTAELLNLGWGDLNKLTRNQMRDVVKQLRSTSDRRIARVEAEGLRSPAATSYKRAGRIDVRNATLNQLRAEVSRQRAFLENPLSTIKGLKESGVSVTDVNREYGDVRDEMTKTELRTAYAVYDKLVEMYPAEYLRATIGTDDTQEKIAEFMRKNPRYKRVDTILRHFMEDQRGGLKEMMADAAVRDRDLDYEDWVADDEWDDEW